MNIAATELRQRNQINLLYKWIYKHSTSPKEPMWSPEVTGGEIHPKILLWTQVGKKVAVAVSCLEEPPATKNVSLIGVLYFSESKIQMSFFY